MYPFDESPKLLRAQDPFYCIFLAMMHTICPVLIYHIKSMVVQRMIQVSIVQAMACVMNWMVHVIVTTTIMVLHAKHQNVQMTVRNRWDGDVAMTIGKNPIPI